MAIKGHCWCGAVQFECAEPPVAARACWCRDCQYLAAGNATVNATFRTAGFTRSGEVSTYISQADSGSEMTRSFCPRCGTPLFSQSSARPDLIAVRAGTLEDVSVATPQAFIWTGSAPDWWQPGDVAQCVGQPPPL
jgi:hypothetical protein